MVIYHKNLNLSTGIRLAIYMDLRSKGLNIRSRISYLFGPLINHAKWFAHIEANGSLSAFEHSFPAFTWKVKSWCRLKGVLWATEPGLKGSEIFWSKYYCYLLASSKWVSLEIWPRVGKNIDLLLSYIFNSAHNFEAT